MRLCANNSAVPTSYVTMEDEEWGDGKFLLSRTKPEHTIFDAPSRK